MPVQDTPPTLSLRERLALVYERLDAMAPPTSAEEAFNRLNTVLEQVEDEYSGVPKNPNPGLKFDGRMYPPRADFTETTPDGHIFAVTKGNTIEAHPDGTLSIGSRKTGETVYHRQGEGASSEVISDTVRSLNNPTIAEAFKTVRRGRRGVARPDETPRSHGSQGTTRRTPPQSDNERGRKR